MIRVGSHSCIKMGTSWDVGVLIMLSVNAIGSTKPLETMSSLSLVGVQVSH